MIAKRQKPKLVIEDFAEFDIDTARKTVALDVDGAAPARRERKTRLDGSIDRRTLRDKGRTVHLNFKAKPQVRKALKKYCKDAHMQMSAFIEDALIEHLKTMGVDVDA